MLRNKYYYSYNTKSGNNNEKTSKNSFSGKKAFFCLFLLVFFAFVLVAYIGQFVKIAHLNYRISQLEEEFDGIQREIAQLNLKLAREMSVARIEKIAKNELNMVEPVKVEFVLLKNKVNEGEDIFPGPTAREIFFVRVINGFLERMSTVRAEELR